jgi:hypothetical protein
LRGVQQIQLRTEMENIGNSVLLLNVSHGLKQIALCIACVCVCMCKCVYMGVYVCMYVCM